MVEVTKEWQTQVVALNALKTMSVTDIAEMVGKPRTTVRDFLRRYKEITESYEEGTTHMYIPDTQVKPGIDMEYLNWIGQYIVRKLPDVIVLAGDHADMPSLSSYDVGTKRAEGQRVQEDIDAAIKGMDILLAPLRKLQAEQLAAGEEVYNPRMVLTLGNHEDRINRHVNANPHLSGFLSIDNLGYEDAGWEVIPFLTPITIDGISYCHYFTNNMTGKPLGGNALNMLKTIGNSFTQGHKQTLDVATRFLPTDGRQQWGIIAGACLEQEHKVLKSSLEYVRLGDIVSGDKLVSFEETVSSKRSRRYKEGTVEAVRKVVKETFEVVLESGKKFIVTEDHLWFVKTGSSYRWVRTDALRKGTAIPKLMDEWETDKTYEGGWIAGMYDGEGSLSLRKTTGGGNFQLSISQNEGPTLDKFKAILADKFGKDVTSSVIRTNKTSGKSCHQLRIKGGVEGAIKVLGSVRPMRLLDKFSPDNMGRISNPNSDNDKVVSITPVGENTVVEIKVDCGTMIVEGYGHHNCYTHEEHYKGVQGNHHWRGLIVKHNVKDGSYDPLFVSLDWLKKEYSK